MSGVLLIFSLVFITISSKRGSILGATLGMLIFLFLLPRKKGIMPIAFIGIIAFIILSLFFSDIVGEIYESRANRFQFQYIENLEQEGRYHEIFRTLENVVGDPIRLLFGYGYFSMGVIFPQGSEYGRQNHIDYLGMLFGLGFYGLILFLYVHFKILRNFIRAYTFSNSEIIKYMAASGIASLVYLSIASISQTMNGIDHRFYIFFIYGGFFRLFQINMKLKKQKLSL